MDFPPLCDEIKINLAIFLVKREHIEPCLDNFEPPGAFRLAISLGLCQNLYLTGRSSEGTYSTLNTLQYSNLK